MIRICIAEENAEVREGIRQILSDIGDMLVAAEAENGYDAAACAGSGLCDAFVLDASMPGPDIRDLIKQILRQDPGAFILVLSPQSEEEYAFRVFRAGASGYLNKSSLPEELVNAVRKIAAGGKYVSAGLSEEASSMFDDGRERFSHTNFISKNRALK
ncbi:MAG TPA: response regulator transcription factor [Desulfosalsimonadaceae bacterium]|nr:response regulator transcription factor [Desulfosalsimonadaceae bacterium]